MGMREENRIKPEEIQGKDRENVIAYCFDKVYNSYEKEIEPVHDQFLPFEKTAVLRIMDP